MIVAEIKDNPLGQFRIHCDVCGKLHSEVCTDYVQASGYRQKEPTMWAWTKNLDGVFTDYCPDCREKPLSVKPYLRVFRKGRYNFILGTVQKIRGRFLITGQNMNMIPRRNYKRL